MDQIIRTAIGAVIALALLAVSPLAQVTKIPPGSGGAAWGSITGTLANQTDLQAALDAVTFDQPLNTTDDVVFARVSVANLHVDDVLSFTAAGGGPLTNGQILATGLALRGRTGSDVEVPLLVWDTGTDRLSLGITSNNRTNLYGGELNIIAGDLSEVYINASVTTGLLIETAAGLSLPINLAPDGDLNINGTPGVTADGFTKGILTDLALAAEGLFASATFKLPSTTPTPAVSNTSANSCGTTAATIAGNNNVGTITVGATAGTSCTMTFTVTAAVEWICLVNNETTANLARATPGSTTTSVFAGTFNGGDQLNYVCIPR